MVMSVFRFLILLEDSAGVLGSIDVSVSIEKFLH